MRDLPWQCYSHVGLTNDGLAMSFPLASCIRSRRVFVCFVEPNLSLLTQAVGRLLG